MWRAIISSSLVFTTRTVTGLSCLEMTGEVDFSFQPIGDLPQGLIMVRHMKRVLHQAFSRAVLDPKNAGAGSDPPNISREDHLFIPPQAVESELDAGRAAKDSQNVAVWRHDHAFLKDP